jgi:DNA repair protein RadC
MRSPHAERPRERMLAHGPQALTTAELLAIVLRTGITGCDSVSMGNQLLRRFGGLRGLLCADLHALLAIKGLGAAKACELRAVSELHCRALEEQLADKQALPDAGKVKQYCAAKLGHHKIEYCIALYLDCQLRLIATEEVARGTLGQASLYPRELVKAALSHHAASVVLAHNHPSGNAQASEADINLTRHLRDALALVDIKLIDHIIVAGNHACSLMEQGYC